jgi:anaerobic selenocysteine-containing dehydrogenase
MNKTIDRRGFLKMSAAGSALCLAGPGFFSGRIFQQGAKPNKLISPGCRKSKVKVAKIYMGIPEPH